VIYAFSVACNFKVVRMCEFVWMQNTNYGISSVYNNNKKFNYATLWDQATFYIKICYPRIKSVIHGHQLLMEIDVLFCLEFRVLVYTTDFFNDVIKIKR